MSLGLVTSDFLPGGTAGGIDVGGAGGTILSNFWLKVKFHKLLLLSQNLPENRRWKHGSAV